MGTSADVKATLLTNGLVLLTGGGDEDCWRFAHAELYDVVKGTFTATGSMTRPRICRSATLLPDGTVLITGGEVTAGSAEVFDPSTGRFASTADMSATRGGHSATALNDGTVLVAGGYSFEAIGQGWVALPAPNYMLHGSLTTMGRSGPSEGIEPSSGMVSTQPAGEIEDCLDESHPLRPRA